MKKTKIKKLNKKIKATKKSSPKKTVVKSRRPKVSGPRPKASGKIAKKVEVKGDRLAVPVLLLLLLTRIKK